MRKIIFISALLAVSVNTFANANEEAGTTKYFETIKNDPEQLLVFLQKMPKGGDLHNHLGGAGMAEHMMNYGSKDHLCINPRNYVVTAGEQCDAENVLDNVTQNTKLYNGIIDAWSMRNFYPGTESGHDHFFATFGKYNAVASTHSGDVLTEVVERAGEQNELYLELMVTPDNDASGMLGKKVGWNSDFAALRQKLLTNGIDNIVNDISKNISADEAKMHKTLYCDTKNAMPGCGVKVRYLYQVLREQPPEQVFGQLLAGFEVAHKDPHVVGINMVQPEDGIISMRDYKLHMQMVGFLHTLYPDVHISLHAGELNSTLVPYNGLRFHIRDAVETAHAERIGHGVDVAYEDNAAELLKEMASKHIMVEINLTSNAEILGVKGDKHPLPLYMSYHVPVALSTDDEGVLRTNLTEQYQQAVLTYHFSYSTIKNLVRNSITYSFLAGKNLWQDPNYRQIVGVCAHDKFNAKQLSAACQAFLNTNEKANMQWDLEKRFMEFEANH